MSPAKRSPGETTSPSMATAKAEPVPLETQIACAKRELAMRKRNYPTWVSAKRMNLFKAQDEIAWMTAIVETLEELQRSKPRT